MNDERGTRGHGARGREDCEGGWRYCGVHHLLYDRGGWNNSAEEGVSTEWVWAMKQRPANLCPNKEPLVYCRVFCRMDLVGRAERARSPVV